MLNVGGYMGPQYYHEPHEPFVLEEEDGSSDVCMREFSLFPLSQYKFTDPCKKCIVQPMCTPPYGTCDDKFKNMDWRGYWDWKFSKWYNRIEPVWKYVRFLIKGTL